MKRSAKFVLNVLLASVMVVGAAWAQNQAPDPRMVAANQLMQEKKFAEAAVAFEAITKEQPGNGRALYQLAMSRFNLQQFPAAAESFEKSFAITSNPLAMYNAACAYARIHQKEKALGALEKAVSAATPLIANPETDSDLAELREDARFKEIIATLDKKKRPCMYTAEARQFDFWIGEWDVLTPQGQKAGTSSIQQVAEGCAIYENWTSSLGTTGKSLNFYDAANKKWYQYWIGPNGGPGRYSGSYSDGAMRYIAEPTVVNGKKTLARLTFFNLDANTVRQFAEASSDDGATWTTQYDFKYVRRKAAGGN